ncbi:hypothetical protein HMPREF9441_00762 [Paraprevotella clara YIT 11840]|uniref:Uncharacterized protein n=1 Tax=Paraprevotella clara YIT 11840 TaxID=762968 RepID=G5SN34_9BACT|nr:hypothetical protein HMPREF9441_00762 [Paraprevotella clara YIT 11840]
MGILRKGREEIAKCGKGIEKRHFRRFVGFLETPWSFMVPFL